MFVEWNFLLAEIWGLLALAVLIGLIGGWLMFGGRKEARDDGEVMRLRAELAREKNRTQAREPIDDIPAMQGGGYVRPSSTPAPMAQTPAPATAPQKPAPIPAVAPPEVKPEPVTASPQTKPVGLTAPRDGLPDDLTKIKGIGAKLEKLCNSLGFWHYEQIAGWSVDEIAWVDDNLEGFKGRVTRDQWVDQAKALAQNATPAFVRRRD